MKPFCFTCMLIVMITGALQGQGVWTQKANFGGGPTSDACAFSIGSKGYIGGTTAELWEYDPINDTWTQKATFTGGTRSGSTAFAIGTKGYIGTGGTLNDFYEWDQLTNTWTQKANFGGSGREGAIGFATSTKGYIGTGGNYLDDLWEYDPGTDTWTQVASMPATGRYHASVFCISDKGYVYGGFDGAFLNDMWEYDPLLNSWTQKSSLPGPARDRQEGFAIGQKGYVVAGWNGSTLNDFYEWDQPTDTWTVMPQFGGSGRYNAVGITIGNKAYVGTGFASGQVADWWEYGSTCGLAVGSQNTTCASVCDGSATVTIPGPGAVVSYAWNTVPVQTTQTATGLCATNYFVTMTDTAGCTGSAAVNVGQPAAISPSATATQPVCAGDSTGSLCGTAQGGSGTYSSWLWSNGQTTICATGLVSGTYTVTVTDDLACTGTGTVILTGPAPLLLSITPNPASCVSCPDGNATANVNGGISPYQFSWSNGVTNSAFISNLLPGLYTCCITDANGCTVCDSTVVFAPSAAGHADLVTEISVYPDPFTDYIQLTSAMNSPGSVSYNLSDISGRVFYQHEFRLPVNKRIHTAHLEPGIYLLRLMSNDSMVVRKLVKN